MNKNYYEKLEPYSLNHKEKKSFFEKNIASLTVHHYNSSETYKKILNFFGYNFKNKKLSEVPFLPTQLFKNYDLKSVSKKHISKILLSSGTSGSLPSKIYLDKNNSHNQTIVLAKIMSTILGKSRLPMLVIDQNPKLIDRSTFNARIAAIYGFSIFGKDHTFILNEKGEINYNLLNKFLHKYGKKDFFVFGFTSFVFENLIKKLSIKLVKGNFKKAILLHGGGWKKMEKIKVTNESFKKKLFKKIGIKNIYNYYGLVEQAGSIFIECKKCSCFIASIYSEVLIRDKKFNIVKNGTKGLIQLFSLLPTSYPGHSIITEDIGKIVESNDCECSSKGKRFKVYGRVKQSEIRGCSDV